MRRTLPLLTLVVLASCASPTTVYESIRVMPIEHVDPALVADGKHKGAYGYDYHQFEVEVTVKAGRIEAADLLTERDYEYSQMAAPVLERIVQRQTPSVDAVSGATTTSKALMKAAEKALKSGLKQ